MDTWLKVLICLVGLAFLGLSIWGSVALASSMSSNKSTSGSTGGNNTSGASTSSSPWYKTALNNRCYGTDGKVYFQFTIISDTQIGCKNVPVNQFYTCDISNVTTSSITLTPTLLDGKPLPAGASTDPLILTYNTDGTLSFYSRNNNKTETASVMTCP